MSGPGDEGMIRRWPIRRGEDSSPFRRSPKTLSKRLRNAFAGKLYAFETFETWFVLKLFELRISIRRGRLVLLA